jgi:hypothetical protein
MMLASQPLKIDGGLDDMAIHGLIVLVNDMV